MHKIKDNPYAPPSESGRQPGRQSKRPTVSRWWIPFWLGVVLVIGGGAATVDLFPVRDELALVLLVAGLLITFVSSGFLESTRNAH